MKISDSGADGNVSNGVKKYDMWQQAMGIKAVNCSEEQNLYLAVCHGMFGGGSGNRQAA